MSDSYSPNTPARVLKTPHRSSTSTVRVPSTTTPGFTWNRTNGLKRKPTSNSPFPLPSRDVPSEDDFFDLAPKKKRSTPIGRRKGGEGGSGNGSTGRSTTVNRKPVEVVVDSESDEWTVETPVAKKEGRKGREGGLASARKRGPENVPVGGGLSGRNGDLIEVDLTADEPGEVTVPVRKPAMLKRKAGEVGGAVLTGRKPANERTAEDDLSGVVLPKRTAAPNRTPDDSDSMLLPMRTPAPKRKALPIPKSAPAISHHHSQSRNPNPSPANLAPPLAFSTLKSRPPPTKSPSASPSTSKISPAERSRRHTHFIESLYTLYKPAKSQSPYRFSSRLSSPMHIPRTAGMSGGSLTGELVHDVTFPELEDTKGSDGVENGIENRIEAGIEEYEERSPTPIAELSVGNECLVGVDDVCGLSGDGPGTGNLSEPDLDAGGLGFDFAHLGDDLGLDDAPSPPLLVTADNIPTLPFDLAASESPPPPTQQRTQRKRSLTPDLIDETASPPKRSKVSPKTVRDSHPRDKSPVVIDLDSDCGIPDFPPPPQQRQQTKVTPISTAKRDTARKALPREAGDPRRPANGSGVSGRYDAGRSDEEMGMNDVNGGEAGGEDYIDCPLCSNPFPLSTIAVHAATCQTDSDSPLPTSPHQNHTVRGEPSRAPPPPPQQASKADRAKRLSEMAERRRKRVVGERSSSEEEGVLRGGVIGGGKEQGIRRFFRKEDAVPAVKDRTATHSESRIVQVDSVSETGGVSEREGEDALAAALFGESGPVTRAVDKGKGRALVFTSDDEGDDEQDDDHGIGLDADRDDRTGLTLTTTPTSLSQPLVDDPLSYSHGEDDDDEQLSPLLGFENPTSTAGRLDWLLAPTPLDDAAVARKEARRVKKAERDRESGRGRGWAAGARSARRARGRGGAWRGRNAPRGRRTSRGGGDGARTTTNALPAPRRNYYANDDPGFTDRDVGIQWEGFAGVTF
ncbi:uncharacterized protein EV422DRAFT_571392 [Fimicolochytrium jonesii]|uniref:uncharacterized protein n=1 Tax=Fimicolochytrium jonesii TaxID=1396493 RepID=UPI0022FDDE30|nr:uncharacterized protein EV422DRAFT_571392 [Fimicolochytrium jonesii]KAI8816861.1 hypothetical protein EV422DRAFT_571392 [Fimicolochytrium jonesii]